MNGVAEYLLTVTSAAVVCSIAKSMAGSKSTAGKITKIVSGVFLTVTLLSPVMNFPLDDVTDFFEDYRSLASEAAASGTEMAAAAMGDIIKEETEAYILDKAVKMDLDITVEVTLCDSDPPAPYQVIITGTVSPYKKNVLSQLIIDDLGIPRENQQWT